jgi:DNA replication protein DnaC
MSAADPIDTGRLSLALNDLRLPAIKLIWPDFAARADKEGWPAARFLAALVEHELAERANRRIQRHLEEARLPPGKTLGNFDFDAVPMLSKAQVMALAAGDSWLERGANLLAFGPPGTGKSHLAAALGLALVENGWRVLGGFKWSSQHLDGGGCDEDWETALGSGTAGRVAAVARSARGGAA